MTDTPDLLLKQAAGVPFYNTSPLTFTKLLDSPNNLAAQLRANLRRRKAQAKARDEAAEPPAPGSRPSQTR